MRDLFQTAYNKFCALDAIQKAILALVSLAFLSFFIQSFIFSSSFEVLSLRNEDNYLFLFYLTDTHEKIINLRLSELFELYHYGYGWLYWIVYPSLTFPFYLISLLGVDFPLIAMSRQISLFFMIGASFLLFKSIKIYTEDKYIPFIAVLLFVGYPLSAEAALDYSTIAQCSFFCLLTFYLIIRHDTLSRKDLKYIALSFAAAIGTKLSTGLFAPLVAIFLMDRFGFKLTKENLRHALYFLKYLIPSAIFFINPSLFLAPFSWSLYTDYADYMTRYIEKPHTDYYNVGRDFLENFTRGIGDNFLHPYILAAFALMFLVKIISDTKSKQPRRFDSLYILIFLIAVTAYLCLYIQRDPRILGFYFANFSPLLLFALTALDRVNNREKYRMLALLIMLTVALNPYNIARNHLYYYYRGWYLEEMQMMLTAQKELQLILPAQKEKLNILIDVRVPLIYGHPRKGSNFVFLYDDISVRGKWSKSEYDYILLYHDSKMMLGEQEFEAVSANADPKFRNIWIESRAMVQSFMESGRFRKSNYKIIYDKNKLTLFERIAPPQ